MSAAESAATAAFVSELVAEGMAERQAEALVVEHNGRQFLAEVTLLDVTPEIPEELCGVGGCARLKHHHPSIPHTWK